MHARTLPGVPVEWWLLAAAGLLVALLQLGTVRETLTASASIDGHFVAEGDTPTHVPAPHRARHWSSWSERAAQQGRLILGPFAAPHTISFHVSGYPNATGNHVSLENRTTGATIAPAVPDPGNFWFPVVVDLPADWRGAPVVLRVIDESDAEEGWLAVAMPVGLPGWAAWFVGVPARITTFLLIGATLAVGATAAARLGFVARLGHPSLRLFAALAVVTIASYTVFWAFFIHRLLGNGLIGAMLVAAAMPSFRRPPDCPGCPWRDREWFVPALLMLGIGLFDVGALHLFAPDVPMSALAQQRFLREQPADNELPGLFARPLESGMDPRTYTANTWLSSDRPPLQTGWDLLLAHPATLLNANHDTATQSAGIWFQLLWIPAVWAWLRAIGERQRRVATIIAMVAASGFLFFQSVYVWPKLGGAALVLGAYVCWFLIGDEVMSPGRRLASGSVLATLGCLAHGGMAFSLLALVPFIVALAWRHRRAWRPAVMAFAAAVALVLPWLGYQKLYDPPGNRLVKMHLAGVNDVDPRGVVRALVDAYSAKSLADWGADRMANLHMITSGDWSTWWRFDFSAPDDRRDTEGHRTLFSLGWWNVGVVIAAIAIGVSRWRNMPRLAAIGRDLGLPLWWSGLTILIWATLMFMPGATVIHQGSYVPLLMLFPLGALALWRVHPALALAVALAETISFCAVWLPEPLHWPELPVARVSVAAMAGAVLLVSGAVCYAPNRGGDDTPAAPLDYKSTRRGTESPPYPTR